MKRLIYGSLFLATIGISVLACKKEAMSPMDSISSAKNTTITQKQKGGLNSASEKSRNENLDSMARAIDLNRIEYDHDQNIFLVNYFHDEYQYYAKIFDFYIDSIINFDIIEGEHTYNVEINVKGNKIDISGIGVFDLDHYYHSYELNSTSNKIKSLVVVMTAYYAFYGNDSMTWSDNGDGDTFHPAGIFWGQVETHKDPCNEILHIQTIYYDDYAFWIRVKHNRADPGHPC